MRHIHGLDSVTDVRDEAPPGPTPNVWGSLRKRYRVRYCVEIDAWNPWYYMQRDGGGPQVFGFLVDAQAALRRLIVCAGADVAAAIRATAEVEEF